MLWGLICIGYLLVWVPTVVLVCRLLVLICLFCDCCWWLGFVCLLVLIWLLFVCDCFTYFGFVITVACCWQFVVLRFACDFGFILVVVLRRICFCIWYVAFGLFGVGLCFWCWFLGCLLFCVDWMGMVFYSLLRVRWLLC